MIVLVCGGRDFADYEYLRHTLDSFSWDGSMLAIIHGGCKGADSLADRWSIEAPYEDSVDIKIFKADWDKHGRAAGPIRNQQMLDEGKPELVLAFAGGKGTDDMCRRARKAGIEVRRFWPGKK